MDSSRRLAGTFVLATACIVAAVWASISVASRPLPGPPVTLTPHTIDLNAASRAELELLPGVGPALAAEIVADRVKRGAFTRVSDLDRVRGIGPATLEEIAPHVRCGLAVRSSEK
ncbi:MAG: helix-hairpin-helix domain-containing protein [Phycisphaerae bacterium]|nr:helix-hairpin-helix domain-containing protein [Phycisphaerae bacterium]